MKIRIWRECSRALSPNPTGWKTLGRKKNSSCNHSCLTTKARRRFPNDTYVIWESPSCLCCNHSCLTTKARRRFPNDTYVIWESPSCLCGQTVLISVPRPAYCRDSFFWFCLHFRRGICMRSFFVGFCLLLSVNIAFGQSDRGTITGAVSDATGAVIPGANVVATNTETATRYET